MNSTSRKSLCVLAAVAVGLGLGGCAIAPTYQYNANNGAGYYRGQSPWGNADTVIETSPAPVWGPWGLAWWGPGWGYPYGYGYYGRFSFGTTVIVP